MVLHAAAIAALLQLPASPWAALPETNATVVRHAIPAPSEAVAPRGTHPFDGAALRVVVGGVAHEIDPLESGTRTVGPDGSTRLHGSVRVGTGHDRADHADRDENDRGSATLAWSLVTGGIQTLFLGFTVVNNSAGFQDFTIIVATPPGFVADTYVGTMTGVLTDLNSDGATLTGPPSGFVYNAAVDGVDAFGLLGPGHSTSVPPGSFAVVGPAAFPLQSGPAMLQSAGLRFDFGLSPFDQATVQGTFTYAR